MNEQSFVTMESKSATDVLAFYDQYASNWDDRFGTAPSVDRFHKARLDSFLKISQLKKTDRLVELGVGTGAYLQALAPLVKGITCVDGSAEMLRVLREKYRTLAKIQVLQLNLESPEAAVSLEADLLYCFGLIEHIVDRETFLNNCKNMLAKNGRMVIVMPNGRCPWYGVIRTLWRSGSHCSSDRYYTKEQLDAIMSAAGFKPAQTEYWGYCPAGVGRIMSALLGTAGWLVDKTWFRRYAGGVTACYRLA